MPIYEYRCERGHTFEVIQRMTDDALTVCEELRRAGRSADRAYDGRSMKAQMKAANRSGAAVAVIIGDDERAAATAVVRVLGRHEGDAQTVVARSDLLTHLEAVLEP